MTSYIIKTWSSALIIAVVPLAVDAAPSARERIEGLTLPRAMALAEEHHPDLAEGRALVNAAGQRENQAGRLPNPEAVGRIESAPLRGRTANGAEYVAGVSQSLPLGGRLAAAKNVARLETEAAAARAELKRREVRSRAHGAFAAALFFDGAWQAHSNNFVGAEALSRITRARVEAGDALRADLARAEMDEVQARGDMHTAEAARRLAIGELGAALGSASLEIGSVEGTLHDALALPQIEVALAEIESNPLVVAAESEAAAQRARVELVRKQRIPDINFDLFYRRIQESRQDAFDAGVRIPLPLFARSGARVREASEEAATAAARAASTRLIARQQLNRGLAELHRALESARMLDREVMPRAQLVLTNAEARYKLGDSSLADVLQKRRDWNAAQTKYLETLREVHEAWRELAAVTATDQIKR